MSTATHENLLKPPAETFRDIVRRMEDIIDAPNSNYWRAYHALALMKHVEELREKDPDIGEQEISAHRALVDAAADGLKALERFSNDHGATIQALCALALFGDDHKGGAR